MTEEKYQIISPLVVVDTYKKIYIKYKGDTNLCDHKFRKRLDRIMSEFKKEVNNFKIIYREITDAYVYEYPQDMIVVSDSDYIKGFINSIILTIMDFAEKMIDLNIYAVHTIIIDIINYYVPLDDIYLHDPSKHQGKKLLTI